MNTKKKKRYLILSAVLFALVLAACITPTMAYFTTYTRAAGGQKIHLGFSTTITETLSNGVKHVTIANQEGSQPVFIRAKAFSALPITCDGENWSVELPAGSISDGQEGYYYYQLPIDGGEATDELDVAFTLPDKTKVNEGDSFGVVVIYESTPVK